MIIKEKIPVVISQTQLDVLSVFNTKAQSLKAPITFADKQYKVLSHDFQDGLLCIELLEKTTNKEQLYKLDLTGTYQIKNLQGVLACINNLKQKGFLIEDENILHALQQVKKLTGLMGRWQILSENPTIIADTGHNEDGIKEVIQNIERYSYRKLHMIIGVVNDKDVTSILKLLPKNASYYFCKANIPRALPEKDLFDLAKQEDLKGKKFTSVSLALSEAKKMAKQDDLIFIGGSTFTVADALQSH
jgi:dihydrofolate synthase/folylpolyglutamate synthase